MSFDKMTGLRLLRRHTQQSVYDSKHALLTCPLRRGEHRTAATSWYAFLCRFDDSAQADRACSVFSSAQ